MLVNGRKIKFLLDLGAMKKFKEATGKNFFAMGEDIDPELLGALIQITAERGGSPLTVEEIDKLTVGELTEIQKEMMKGMEGIPGDASPLRVSRQN